MSATLSTASTAISANLFLQLETTFEDKEIIAA